MTGKMFIVQRGECTFLQKAKQVNAVGGSVIAIINNIDKLESPSSGLGIDKTIKEDMVLAVKDICVVMIYSPFALNDVLTQFVYDKSDFAV